VVRTGGAGNLTEHKYYVGDVIITQRSGGTDTFYTHKDFQGSVVATSNQNGAVISQAIYDPFGKRSAVYRHIDLIAGSYTEPTEKGYTGHKEIPELDIIHMKGRIYDANLGRFLQADPLVQSPMSSQSYNRYSYVFNNPMTYTDPSGFSAWTDFRDKILRPIVAIAAAYFLGPVAQFVLGPMSGAMLTGFVSGGIATGSLRGAVTGAITGAIFSQIGSAFNESSGFWETGGAGHIGSHGLAGGIISDLQGGKFGHGFFSAGFTKAMNVNRIVGTDPSQAAHRITLAAIVGGTVSKLTGGKFANGAVTAALAQAFNGERDAENAEFKKFEDALKQQKKNVVGHMKAAESLKTIEAGHPVGGAVYKNSRQVLVGYDLDGVPIFRKSSYFSISVDINTEIPTGDLSASQSGMPHNTVAIVVYHPENVGNLGYNLYSYSTGGLPFYVTYESTGLTHVYTTSKDSVYSCSIQGGGKC